MKTMKFWRNILVMTAAMLSLASCSSDDNVERRLSNTQKETYGQNISGSYPGQYVITYKDKDCKEWTDEEGRHHNEAVCNSMCPTTRCSMYSFKTSPCR